MEEDTCRTCGETADGCNCDGYWTAYEQSGGSRQAALAHIRGHVVPKFTVGERVALILDDVAAIVLSVRVDTTTSHPNVDPVVYELRVEEVVHDGHQGDTAVQPGGTVIRGERWLCTLETK